MRKKSLLVVLAAVAVATLAPATASAAKSKAVFNLKFDGYCDGMALNRPSAGLGTEGTIDGEQTGCVTGGVFGTNSTGAAYLTVPTFSTFTVIKGDNTWVHYGFNGNLIYVLNSGTWSPGTPDGRAGTPSTTPQTHAAKPMTPAATVDITFDGYCDGMQLNNPSLGLGTSHSVDGMRTGCASEAVIGATTTITGKNVAAVTFNTFGLWVQTAIFNDQTWIHYAVDGNLIYVLNSGTWSFGPPADDAGRASTG